MSCKKKGMDFESKIRGEILDLTVYQFGIRKLGYDPMGYILEKNDQLSYHHIIPVFYGGKTTSENCCPLIADKSHAYIHVVERYDPKLFWEISYEIMAMKEKGYIDQANLMAIHQMLNDFENRFDGEYNIKNHLIIKPEFKVRIQKFIH